jgi:hypothetical protein
MDDVEGRGSNGRYRDLAGNCQEFVFAFEHFNVFLKIFSFLKCSHKN